MDYKRDVFISYCRPKGRGKEQWYTHVRDWLKKLFQKTLLNQLADELKRKPNLFVDDQIEIGDVWSLTLVEELRHSRCIVPVWSPYYFESE